jgi:hypothetical protein
MGSQHSLPREEADQYGLVQSWIAQSEARLDWLKSQGKPSDSPESEEALDYYGQLLLANVQWRVRESEHRDCVGNKETGVQSRPCCIAESGGQPSCCRLLLVCPRSGNQRRLSSCDRKAASCARATLAG